MPQSSRARRRLSLAMWGVLALDLAWLVLRGDSAVVAVDGVLESVTLVLPSAVCWCAVSSAGARRREVQLVAVAATLFTCGALTFLLTVLVTGEQPRAFPSAADLFYLPTYVALLAAVATAVRRRLGTVSGAVLLDGLIGGLGAAAVLSLLLARVFEQASGGALRTAGILAYPLLDLLLVAAVAGVVALTGLPRALAAPAAGPRRVRGRRRGLRAAPRGRQLHRGDTVRRAVGGRPRAPGELGDPARRRGRGRQGAGRGRAHRARAGDRLEPGGPRLGGPPPRVGARRHPRDPDGRRHRRPHAARVRAAPPARGPAPAGLHRRAHRPAQPPRVRGARRSAPDPRQRAGGAAAAGPGPVQGGQRQPRAPRSGTSCCAGSGRGCAASCATATCSPGWAATSSPCC